MSWVAIPGNGRFHESVNNARSAEVAPYDSDGSASSLAKTQMEKADMDSYETGSPLLERELKASAGTHESSEARRLIAGTPRAGDAVGAGGASGLTRSLAEVEQQYILAVLEANQWNRTKSAKILGIDVKTLYNKLKRYKVKPGPELG